MDDDDDGLIDAFDPDCECGNTIDSVELVSNGDFESKIGCCQPITNFNNNCVEDWIYIQGSPDYYHEDCIDPMEASEIEEFFEIPIKGGFMGLGITTNNNPEAMGICLNEPILAGETYTFSFDFGKESGFLLSNLFDDIILTFIGIPACSNLNNYFNNTGNICDAGLPYEEFGSLNAFIVNAGWNNFEFQITPTMDIEAIIPYRSCTQPNSSDQVVYAFYDNISIKKTSSTSITSNIIVNGTSCDGTLQYMVEDMATSTYQWYFNQQPIIGATNSLLTTNQMELDSTGEYHVYVTYDNGSCQLVGPEMYEPIVVEYEILETICEGGFYNFNNENLTAAGIYRDTIQTATGCDSILILDLSFNEMIESSFSQTICEGDFYNFNNENLTAAGIYRDTIQTVTGCDSILILDLSFNEMIESSFSETICEGDFYNFNNENLTAAGIYRDTIQTVTGCDSILILDLSFNETIEFFSSETICEGDFYNFNNENLTAAGIYRDTIQTVTGCDSILILDLSFNEMIESFFSQTICEGGFYNFNNENLTVAGIYRDTIQTARGCDSILVLDLSFNEIIESSFSETICEGETYLFGDLSITTSGEYEQIFTSISTDCDSLVMLTINFNPAIFGDTINIEQEENTSYNFQGTLINQPGIYAAILPSSAGCDSTVYLNFNFIAPCQTSLMIEWNEPSCDIAQNGWIDFIAIGGKAPYTYSIDGGENFVNTNLFENLPIGEYDLVVMDVQGCIENVFFDLESLPAELFVELPADTSIYLGQSFALNISSSNFEPASYLWTSDQNINCANCPTAQIIASSSGTYNLTATDENGCEASDEIFIATEQATNLYFPNVFSPNGDNINESFSPLGKSADLERVIDMQIFSRWGELVFEQKGLKAITGWDGTIKGKAAIVEVYIYKVRWTNPFGREEVLSGDVMLVR